MYIYIYMYIYVCIYIYTYMDYGACVIVNGSCNGAITLNDLAMATVGRQFCCTTVDLIGSCSKERCTTAAYMQAAQAHALQREGSPPAGTMVSDMLSE